MSQFQQSPINLQPTIQSASPINLQYEWKLTEGVPHYGVHGLEIVFEPSEKNRVTLDGKQYLLRNFHFHNPSEHYLESRPYRAELHIVSQNLDDLSYVVLGVFLQILKTDSEDADETGSFFKGLNTEFKPLPVLPQNWIPRTATHIVRYEGSLTTSPFAETVSWAVYNTPKLITESEYGRIFPRPEPNARGLQPLNRRFVVNYPLK
jgi:carbonic anhydrase